jgi:hypothetical protein
MEPQATCTYCKGNISSTDYFCPNCGKKLKEKPLSTSLLRQVLIYSLSFFLPPLGIWPAIKYLRQQDQKSKNVGLVALILTVVSIVITIYISIDLLNSYTKYLGDQVKIYQDLGL